jgi:uncharacterized protein YndB with AHSA1/START domain
MNASQTTPNAEQREFVMDRLFDAPRELVFQVWSDPKHLAHWWGPKGWSLPVCTMDFRPGGAWHYCMRGPGGEESWGKATYQEITPPERIVYIDAFADADGNVVADAPQMVVTVTFSDEQGKTRLTNHIQFASAKELQEILAMGMNEGMIETWDRLEQYLNQLRKG